MAHIDIARWKILSPLLDRLLDSTPEERRNQLDLIRHDDPVVASELEAMLAHQPAVDREAFLEGYVLRADASLASNVEALKRSEDLQRGPNRKPAGPRADSPAHRMARFLVRYRWALTAAAAVALLLWTWALVARSRS